MIAIFILDTSEGQNTISSSNTPTEHLQGIVERVTYHAENADFAGVGSHLAPNAPYWRLHELDGFRQAYQSVFDRPPARFETELTREIDERENPMANEEQLALLRQDVAAWNQWATGTSRDTT